VLLLMASVLMLMQRQLKDPAHRVIVARPHPRDVGGSNP
jgi:hypothetical protein